MLNILQVGESVAQNVCAKLVLALREEDYRNHAAAQAMDEARHHLAYRRFLDKMGEEVEDIDLGTEMMFDALLAPDDPLELIATEQFFLESLAMNIFEGIREHATHPLLRRIVELITRDESRHMGFGVLYIAEWMRAAAARRADRLRAPLARADPRRRSLDRPGPIMLARVVRRLREAGRRRRRALAPQMLREQQEINAAELAAAASGAKVPHLLKSARRAGLLEPEILEALGLAATRCSAARCARQRSTTQRRPDRPARRGDQSGAAAAANSSRRSSASPTDRAAAATSPSCRWACCSAWALRPRCRCSWASSACARHARRGAAILVATRSASSRLCCASSRRSSSEQRARRGAPARAPRPSARGAAGRRPARARCRRARARARRRASSIWARASSAVQRVAPAHPRVAGPGERVLDRLEVGRRASSIAEREVVEARLISALATISGSPSSLRERRGALVVVARARRRCRSRRSTSRAC